MSLPPPPQKIHQSVYGPGAVIGLGRVEGWDQPYCITTDFFTCTSLPQGANTIDPVTGDELQDFTLPYNATYYWPEWSATIDYSDPKLIPQVGWKVLYNGLYYEPTIWLSSSQVGKEPNIAEAVVGDPLGINFDVGQHIHTVKKTRCKNQSHAIRAWGCLGSLESDNYWQGTAGEIFPEITPDNEYRRNFIPVFLNEWTSKPQLAGGDGFGYCIEEYYPKPHNLVVYVEDPEATAAAKEPRIKVFDGTKSKPEPIGWDRITGAMPAKEIAEISPYALSFYYNFVNIDLGISMTLWQQKVKVKAYETKKVEVITQAGEPPFTWQQNNISWLQKREETVVEAPIQAGWPHIVDKNPGGYSSFLVYAYRSNTGPAVGTIYTPPSGDPVVTSFQDPNNYSIYANTNTQKYNVFYTMNHPLVWTREAKYYYEVSTESDAYRWVYLPFPPYTPTNPPQRFKTLEDEQHTYTYPEVSLKMGLNQHAVSFNLGPPPSYFENSANKVATYTFKEENIGTELTSLTRRMSGISFGEWALD